MRLSELIEGGGATAHNIVPDIDITGLTADSRDVRPGFLFAALPGAARDGRDYIGQAIEKGATAVLAPPTVQPNDIKGGAQLIRDPTPRRQLSLMAARFYQAQPDTVAAVTGTNGKTSVTNFVHQLWTLLGHRSAALGTLGITAPGREAGGGLTTPDPVRLHESLAALKRDGFNHLAIEASSHGLDQYRLDGVRIAAAAFTNLSRDHLDYHETMDAYLDSKLRLFTELLRDGGTAVVDADSPQYDRIADIVRHRRLHLLTYGRNDGDIRCRNATNHEGAWSLSINALGKRYKVDFALPGAFQIDNALCALALVIGCGAAPQTVVPLLSRLVGVPGRMQVAGRRSNGATVIVDYAHTPDALATVLQAARPYAANRLIVIFGCGGDRDPGKRAEMGAAAAKLADAAIVTDDNPRGEDPAAIRQQALSACPKAQEIGDRREAIHTGIAMLEAGDILVVAGKGHEQGQTAGGKTLPFDDVTVAREAIDELGGGAA
ncbi:MAG: UDP-N-acetylmuramoyl-L-alanyl-D-glutamate--2,6-diaminopimelate ligase [Alphaproteobacteria bacterium]|nr:UDP-N-acetylmuramoyl-L-alanyl-D-glutamate--2,6-diaminopimelate ligase [Alphaproteobacteria bacterium]